MISEFGETIEKMRNVEYCKTIGFGAPENENQENTLYMYGRPCMFDHDRLFRSQDGGNS